MTGARAPARPPETRSIPSADPGIGGGRATALLVAAVSFSVVASIIVTAGRTADAPAPAPAAETDGDASGSTAAPATAEPVEAPRVARDPTDVGEPVGSRAPTTVSVELEATEVRGQLADGTAYGYWTFNGTVPGPMIRVREGDTVELSLSNATESTQIHSIDLHAVNGPGGGAAATNLVSSFHVIGEIFDEAHVEGGATVNRDVQTTLIPAGGATWVEFTIDQPGDYLLVDHSITRTIDKGALATIHAEGPGDPDRFRVPDGQEDAADPHDTSAGDDNSAAGEAAGDAIEVTMSEFAFDLAQTELPAGTTTFRVHNDGAVPHEFALGPAGTHGASQHAVDTGNVAPGETVEVTAELEPGEYEIACHITGHYEAGMQQTVTVTG